MAIVWEIVEHLYSSHVSPSGGPTLAVFFKKFDVHHDTINRLRAGLPIKGPTKRRLAEAFTAWPGCGTVLPEWFDATSLDEFLELRGQHKKAVTTIGIELPKNGNPALLDNIAGNYVTYRFAFDILSGGTAVSREFMALEREGDHLKFEMFYRVTGRDEQTAPLVYRGEAAIAGGSVAAIGVSNVPRAPDREPSSRVRCLLFAHTVEKEQPENDRDLKFGILSSTRMEMHEACSACIVMFRVNTPLPRLEEFRDKIALVRQWVYFKDADFGNFKDATRIQNHMEILMKNVPRQDDTYDDKVLRLHFDRFRSIRAMILHETRTNKGLHAPWTASGMVRLLANPGAKYAAE